MKYSLVILLIIISTCTFSSAAVWQWSVGTGSARAYLWIPENCKQVRGVMLANHNMQEAGILEHPAMRKTLADLDIAQVWVIPTLSLNFDFTKDAPDRFQKMMDDLAEMSGYQELKQVPVIPLGHSAHATFPWNFAAWNPQRTIGVLSIKGDAPQTNLTGYGRANVPWGDRNIDGVPGLMVMSENEWWDDRLTPAQKFFNEHPKAPIASFCDAGNGHFNQSDELVSYLSIFVRKIVEKRMPRGYEKLLPIDPRDGWLMERWHKDMPSSGPAAPYEKYSGDRSQAFWCVDEEMAQVTEKYYQRTRGKKPQLVGFVQDGKILSGEPCTPAVKTGEDGITFHLPVVFLDKVEGAGGNPEKWANGLVKGTSLGHASGNVLVDKIVGPVQHLSDDQFQICLDRTVYTNDRRNSDAWVYAYHPGDEQYRSNVQQAQIKLNMNTTGQDQEIGFPDIPDQTRNTELIELKATSSSGLPVRYYVVSGPAEVVEGKLKITPIPPAAKLPIEIEIVAWQWGRAINPVINTARPVEKTFKILP